MFLTTLYLLQLEKEKDGDGSGEDNGEGGGEDGGDGGGGAAALLAQSLPALLALLCVLRYL